MSTKKRILLVETYTRLKHAGKIADLFRSYSDFEVKRLGPDDKHKHPNCVVLLPDVGINANISYFLSSGSIPPNVPPQDQLLEYWKLNMMGYYVNNKIGICGIGHSAFLIFAELLKGQLMFGKDGLQPTGDIHKTAKWDDDLSHFTARQPLCAGYTGTELDEDFVVFVDQHFFDNKELVSVMVENPPPVMPNNAVNKW